MNAQDSDYVQRNRRHWDVFPLQASFKPERRSTGTSGVETTHLRRKTLQNQELAGARIASGH